MLSLDHVILQSGACYIFFPTRVLKVFIMQCRFPNFALEDICPLATFLLFTVLPCSDMQDSTTVERP